MADKSQLAGSASALFKRLFQLVKKLATGSRKQGVFALHQKKIEPELGLMDWLCDEIAALDLVFTARWQQPLPSQSFVSTRMSLACHRFPAPGCPPWCEAALRIP